MATKYRITAARSDTKSAASTVRQAEWNPRSTLVRTLRPVRASSFKRSKYTMYESTVMPIETIRPVTPANVKLGAMVV